MTGTHTLILLERLRALGVPVVGIAGGIVASSHHSANSTDCHVFGSLLYKDVSLNNRTSLQAFTPGVGKMMLHALESSGESSGEVSKESPSNVSLN